MLSACCPYMWRIIGVVGVDDPSCFIQAPGTMNYLLPINFTGTNLSPSGGNSPYYALHNVSPSFCRLWRFCLKMKELRYKMK